MLLKNAISILRKNKPIDVHYLDIGEVLEFVNHHGSLPVSRDFVAGDRLPKLTGNLIFRPPRRN